MNRMAAIAFAQRYGLLIVLAAGVAIALASGATDHITLAELKARRAELAAFVEAHRLSAIAVYVALYAVVVALSLPLALVLTLAGGFLFGPFLGALAAVSSATLGSTVAFLAARTAFGDYLAAGAGPTVARLVEGFRKDAFAYLFTLRIIPVAPLQLINLGAGLAGVRIATFMAASFIGMAPGSFIYAWLGSGLGTIFARGEQPDLGLIMEPSIFLPLLGLGLLALAPTIHRRLRGGRGPLA